ncbi:MAG: hypothetical protein LBJ64_05155 [Deltaproteobacteria bacterium]|nr:hypothetical protein [Deltaproteobacteria bacterium]
MIYERAPAEILLKGCGETTKPAAETWMETSPYGACAEGRVELALRFSATISPFPY